MARPFNARRRDGSKRPRRGNGARNRPACSRSESACHTVTSSTDTPRERDARRRIAAIANASRSYLGQWYDSPDDLISLIKDPWVAGRPMLPDGLPALDVLPSTGNAFVSTGHGMLGVTLAPVSGRAIADFVHTGRRPAILQPFRSDRFRPRARSTERKTMRLTA